MKVKVFRTRGAFIVETDLVTNQRLEEAITWFLKGNPKIHSWNQSQSKCIDLKECVTITFLYED